MLETRFLKLSFVKCDPELPAAAALLDELSDELFQRFESDGRRSFNNWDPSDPLHVFIVARSGDEVVGCGAIRPLGQGVGEIKRMFAKYRRCGIGSAILRELEQQAQLRNYQCLWLATRVANKEAVAFYLSQSYRVRENFGRYVDDPKTICFEKQLGS